MKRQVRWIILAGMVAILCLPLAVTANATAADEGWYIIHSNVQGADVYFDNQYMGTVEAGTLSIPAYSSSGTPYQMIVVRKYGYASYSDSLPAAPGQGMSVDIYATLNPYPATPQTLSGVDEGWYLIRCNVDGAVVKFDGVEKGEISQGVLYVAVPVEGTPYRTFTVEKDGYTTYYGTISRLPLTGETIDLFATLNPLPTATTQSLIGGSVGWFVVTSNVDGARVSFDNDVKGQITGGNLTVQVYTTATPYKTFTVYKEGYAPYTGAITQYPAQGETVYLNATLSIQETTAPTPIPTAKSPLMPEIPVLALALAGIGTIASRKIHR